MGGGASKQSDAAKKFQTTSTVTVDKFKIGEDGEKSTTVGGSKKLYLIIGDVKMPEEQPRQKISPFGRQTGLAVGCKIGKSVLGLKRRPTLNMQKKSRMSRLVLDIPGVSLVHEEPRRPNRIKCFEKSGRVKITCLGEANCAMKCETAVAADPANFD